METHAILVPDFATPPSPSSPDRSVSIPRPARALLVARRAKGETREALEHALWRARERESSECEIAALLALALWHGRLGHWGEAVEMARAGAERAGRAAKGEAKEIAQLVLGSVQYRRGRWGDAALAWSEIEGSGEDGSGRRFAARLGRARLALRRGSLADFRAAMDGTDRVEERDLRLLRHVLEAEAAAWCGEVERAASELAAARSLHGGCAAGGGLLAETARELLAAEAQCHLAAGARKRAEACAIELGRRAQEDEDVYRWMRSVVLLEEARGGSAAGTGGEALRALRVLGPGAAGRFEPWLRLLGERAVCAHDDETELDLRIETLLVAHRAFARLGERRGEFESALELARVKRRNGACRGAFAWLRRARSASGGDLAPRAWRSRLAEVALELERGLAERVARDENAVGAGTVGVEEEGRGPVSGGVEFILETYRRRMGARRATLWRREASGALRALACLGDAAPGEGLAKLAERLGGERLESLEHGETVVWSQFEEGVGAVAEAGQGAILVPVAGAARGLTVLCFEGCEEEERFLPGVEALLLAGDAARAARDLLQLAPLCADGEGAEQTTRLGPILTRDARLRETLLVVNRLVRSDVPVLLCGETGTGKDLVAHALHDRRGRRGPFVAQNCAALPESLLETELFGHATGAFTGAVRARRGLFEAAHGGTLFLDEVAEMGAPLQAKLLRVLETGELRPLGETRSRRILVRVVSATNRDLEMEVAAGRFREDLFYRLNVVTLLLPPLRERPLDVPLLARHFLAEAERNEGKRLGGFTRAALEGMARYGWPGNVRELRNRVRRAAALALPGEAVDSPLLGLDGAEDGREEESLADAVRRFERDRIREALARAGGNRTRAAALLGGMRRTTLIAKMKRHGLT